MKNNIIVPDGSNLIGNVFEAGKPAQKITFAKWKQIGKICGYYRGMSKTASTEEGKKLSGKITKEQWMKIARETWSADPDEVLNYVTLEIGNQTEIADGMREMARTKPLEEIVEEYVEGRIDKFEDENQQYLDDRDFDMVMMNAKNTIIREIGEEEMAPSMLGLGLAGTSMNMEKWAKIGRICGYDGTKSASVWSDEADKLRNACSYDLWKSIGKELKKAQVSARDLEGKEFDEWTSEDYDRWQGVPTPKDPSETEELFDEMGRKVKSDEQEHLSDRITDKILSKFPGPGSRWINDKQQALIDQITKRALNHGSLYDVVEAYVEERIDRMEMAMNKYIMDDGVYERAVIETTNSILRRIRANKKARQELGDMLDISQDYQVTATCMERRLKKMASMKSAAARA